MNIAFLIGRIIFGGYWLMASFNHFKNHLQTTLFGSTQHDTRA